MSKQQQLAARPPLDDAIASYEKICTTIQERLTADFGVAQWTEEPNSAEFSGCAPQFPDLSEQEAGKKLLSRWYSPTSLPAPWNQVKQAVREVAGAHGFTTVTLDTHQAGDAEFNLADQLGAQPSFGTSKNTVLSLTTGCHLVNK